MSRQFSPLFSLLLAQIEKRIFLFSRIGISDEKNVFKHVVRGNKIKIQSIFYQTRLGKFFQVNLHSQVTRHLYLKLPNQIRQYAT